MTKRPASPYGHMQGPNPYPPDTILGAYWDLLRAAGDLGLAVRGVARLSWQRWQERVARWKTAWDRTR